MSYENPITVVDTESAKIRAAGMVSFGQSIGGALTALGQRQREEAKETKKANKAFLKAQTGYNAEYQQNSWLATDDYKKDAGFDISPQVTTVFNKWATEGAKLKAERDRSDDPIVRAGLDAQIAVYDKFFLGGGMTSNLESFAELQKTIQTEGAPGKGGNVGGLSLSNINQVLFEDFMGLGRGNGGKDLKITGIGGQIGENGQYSPLSLEATFDGREKGYNMSELNNDLIIIPDMQDGTRDVLEKEGYLSGNNLNFNSQGFKNFIKTNENGKVEYTVGYDAQGKEKRYQKLDFNTMHDSLSPTYQASIVGYTRQGSVTDGDSSLGYRTMQSYIDDELEDMSEADKKIFKEHVGLAPEEITLQIGNAEGTLLTEESLETYKKALTAQKLIELQKKMPGEDYNTESYTQSEINALKKAKTTQEIDNELTNVVQSAITGADTADEGLYNYLMDASNADNLGYDAASNKSFRNVVRPIEDAAKYLDEADKKVFFQATGVNIDADEDGEIKKQEIAKRIKELKASGNKFFSLSPQDIMEPLEEADAYNRLMQTIPMFQNLSNRALSKRKGDLDKKERDRRNSPPYQAEKKLKTLGSLEDYKKKLKGSGGKWLNSKATTEAEINEEYLEKIDAMTTGLSEKEKDILLKKLGIKK